MMARVRTGGMTGGTADGPRGAFTYDGVGSTHPDAADTRVVEVASIVGSGTEWWREAVLRTMSWEIQRAAGYTVIAADPGGADIARRPVAPTTVMPGQTVRLTRRFGPIRVSAPVRVVYVVDDADRAGFAFGTLRGHPVAGEAAFIVERRADGTVWFVLRSMSGSGPGLWFLARPLIALVRGGLEAGYRRGLTDPRLAGAG